MLQVRLSPRARFDLIEIWTYIADDSVARADAFIDRVDRTMRLLGGNSRAGRRRDELAPGILSFPLGRYVIFYRMIQDTIEIVRVLHGARDIQTIFED